MANTPLTVEDLYIGDALPLFGVDSIVDGLSTITDVVVYMLVEERRWTIAMVGECMATISGMMADDVIGRGIYRYDQIYR